MWGGEKSSCKNRKPTAVDRAMHPSVLTCIFAKDGGLGGNSSCELIVSPKLPLLRCSFSFFIFIFVVDFLFFIFPPICSFGCSSVFFL